MKQAKDVARSYRAFDGQVTFHMIPWNTLMVQTNITRLSKLLGKPFAEFDTAEKLFASADALTVDIEFADALTPELEGLQAYWHGRNGDFAARFDGYMRYLSEDVFIEWLTAYGETRDHSLEAESELQPPTDDDPKKKSRMNKR